MSSDSEKRKHSLRPSADEVVLDPNWEQLSLLLSQDVEGRRDSTFIESYRRLRLIYELGRAILSEAKLDSVFEAVVDSLGRVINLERCFVATFNERGQLTVRAAHDLGLPEDVSEWPVSKTVLNRVVNEGVALLSTDAVQDGRLAGIQSLDTHNIRSLLCVPMGPKGSCRGVIYADSRRSTGTFTELDLIFVTALSHYIDIGIQNASRLDRAKEARVLSDERWKLAQEELLSEHEVVGASPQLLSAYERLRQAAASDVPILIQGETGTGKELFAKAAHRMSGRSSATFMPVNIAALSETLIESELFGHEKGAFSGADSRKPGRFELADGGTLFLDEVADIPANVQPKLLRVLESGEFERVGGTGALRADVRIICATNQDLKEKVDAGAFREDLFYRISGVTVELPPLRERAGDIPDLVSHVLERLGSEKKFSEAAVRSLQSYRWPGNVRELAKVVEAMDALCTSDEIGADGLPKHLAAGTGGEHKRLGPLPEAIARLEADYIRQALEISGGNSERAIEMLGISRATFFNRKKRYGL